MKVLHLLQSPHFSGAENVVCQIIKIFKNDNDIEMVYCSQDGPIRDELYKRQIRFCPIKKLCLSEVKRVLQQEKPDLIHAHDFSASVIAALFGKHIHVISHLHCNPPWLSKIGPRSVSYFLVQFGINRILTVSDSVMDEYIFGKSVKNKTIVIGNPVDTSYIRKKAQEASIIEGSDIMFLGRMSEPKNPFQFVEIVKKLKKQDPNIRAIMVGNGELFDQVNEMICHYDLVENIKMFGFQENPYGLLNNTKILCMPSNWEGFGLAAVEALTLGKPVVCSKVGGLPEIIDEDCGYLCKNTSDFVNAISALLSDSRQYCKKSENAESKAIELNNYKEYKNNLENCYKPVLVNDS